MVPVTCNVCQKRVMLWDARPVFAYEYDHKAMGHKVLSANVCNDCLPDDRLREEPTRKPHHNVELDAAVDIYSEEPAPFSQTEEGSQDRFDKRKREVPWLKHTFWWLVHNCVAHPLIGVLPFTPLFKFHDWTSVKMHGRTW